jgi:hypothetical protein
MMTIWVEFSGRTGSSTGFRYRVGIRGVTGSGGQVDRWVAGFEDVRCEVSEISPYDMCTWFIVTSVNAA